MTEYERAALCSLACYLDENPRRQMTLGQVTRCFGWRDEAHAYRAMQYALRLTQGRVPPLTGCQKSGCGHFLE